jgi:ankyrin repeat protein
MRRILTGFFSSRIEEENQPITRETLALKATSGNKDEFMACIKQVNKENVITFLLQTTNNEPSVWHKAAKHQKTGGFVEFLRYLSDNKLIEEKYWHKLLAKKDSNGQTALHLAAINNLHNTSRPLSEQFDKDTLATLINEEIKSPHAIAFNSLINFIISSKIINEMQWYDLLCIQNNNKQTILHIAVREQISMGSITTLFTLLEKKQSLELLCIQDENQCTVLDIAVQYQYNLTELETLTDKLDEEQWRVLFNKQQEQSPRPSLLHHAAQYQDSQGFEIFLNKLPDEQQSLLFQKNELEQTVLDIAAESQLIDGLNTMAKHLDIKQLEQALTQKENVSKTSRVDITGADQHQKIKVLYMRSNIICILICLKFIQGRKAEATQSIEKALNATLENPTEDNKTTLIESLKPRNTSCNCLWQCLSSDFNQRKELADLIEQQYRVPVYYVEMKI